MIRFSQLFVFLGFRVYKNELAFDNKNQTIISNSEHTTTINIAS